MPDDLLVRDLVVLAYKAFDGRMRGKTLLQKRLYFLSVMLEADLGYEAHYYGPYSAEVASANAELKSMGFVGESSSVWGVDASGFELARYDYCLTEAGWRLADRKASADVENWGRVKRAAQMIRQAGDLDYVELSIAAKAYFVLLELKGKATLEDIAAMLPRFGWSVTQAQLKKAGSFLEQAGLVTRA